MKLGSIFGPVFFSVLAGLIIYDLVVKGLVGGIFPANKYDNTFDPTGAGIDNLRKLVDSRESSAKIVRGQDGKLYMIRKQQNFAA